MSEISMPLYRRLLPWVVGVGFLVTAAIALWRIGQLREDSIERERDRQIQYLEDQVADWEDELIKDLEEAIKVVAADPSRAEIRQKMMRDSEKWFDSLYVWELDDAVDSKGRRRRQILFPHSETPENYRQLANNLCLARLRRVKSFPETTTDDVKRTFHLACVNEDIPTLLVATTETATWLEANNEYEEALAVLNSLGTENLGLAEAARKGLPPFRIATQRLQRADLLRNRLNREEEALDLLYRTGLEICSLDAFDAHNLLDMVGWPILPTLKNAKRTQEVKRLLSTRYRAERRITGMREIVSRIIPQRPTNEHRFVYDQYSQHPFLLYYGWEDERIGVAFQLEQKRLLSDFLNTRLRSLSKVVTITDANGEYVAGTRGGGEITASVSFGSTLTHLRIGLRESALRAARRNADDQWTVPLVLIGVCVFVVFGALYLQFLATRQQFEMMMRQREFTTRVTHELKTPLAGIRVMAENIELGAFKSDEQREMMARRIMEEADKLTRRVDEVLNTNRQRHIEEPTPFDPEDACLQTLEQWAPRLHDAKVTLHVDLHPTDLVLGDLDAFRDAVGCLLDNTLKYRDEAVSDNKVWLELKQVGKRIVLAVSDNGLGVPKNLRKTIFERFVRVEGPNRGKSGGHGLGLHQVYQVVKNHKGTIYCEEGIDGGARFVIEVPAFVG